MDALGGLEGEIGEKESLSGVLDLRSGERCGGAGLGEQRIPRGVREMRQQLCEKCLRAGGLAVGRAGQGSESDQEWIVGQRAGQSVEVVKGSGGFSLQNEGLQNARVSDSGELGGRVRVLGDAGEHRPGGVEFRAIQPDAGQHEEASGLFGGRRGRRGKQDGLGGGGVPAEAELLSSIKNCGLRQQAEQQCAREHGTTVGPTENTPQLKTKDIQAMTADDRCGPGLSHGNSGV